MNKLWQNCFFLSVNYPFNKHMNFQKKFFRRKPWKYHKNVLDILPGETLLSVCVKCSNFRLLRVLKQKSTLFEVLNGQRVPKEGKRKSDFLSLNASSLPVFPSERFTSENHSMWPATERIVWNNTETVRRGVCKRTGPCPAFVNTDKK